MHPGIFLWTVIYLLQKSVDMLLHVTAGKFNNMCRQQPHWVAIGISLYKSDNFSLVYNCVFQYRHDTGIVLNWYSHITRKYMHAATPRLS